MPYKAVSNPKKNRIMIRIIYSNNNILIIIIIIIIMVKLF